MARQGTILRLIPTSILLPALVMLASLGLYSKGAGAQQQRGVVAEGYITAVHPPLGFDVNGMHVATTPAAGYRLVGEKAAQKDSPLRDAVQVGAYVVVEGRFDKRTRTANAKTVVFRDDGAWKLFGLGVIDKVVSNGPEPVFRSDGYEIYINSDSKVEFQGQLKTLADVGLNTWIRFEGRRNKDGVVVASKAMFFAANAERIKEIPRIEVVDAAFEAPDMDQHKDGRVQLGPFDARHVIPADRNLQERVTRVGMSVVPSYQKTIPDGSPFKLDFHFYAVDDDKLRSDGCVLHGNLILISKQAVERLKNDSQLAAVLADGIALDMQRQKSSTRHENYFQTEPFVVDALLVPPVFFVFHDIGGFFQKVAIVAVEQRGRIALALMADAGYDPWQAPEAWRLLAPENLPSDLNSLKYPNRSGYQLGILNLQYRTKADLPIVKPAP